MPAPTSYTESTLKEYLIREVLVQVATKLGWTTASVEITNAVNETMLALNSTDLAEFDTPVLIRKLRAFARREAWLQAAQVTAAKINLSADGASVDLAQMHAQCKAMYTMTRDEVLAEYGGNETGEAPVGITITSRDCHCDPYTPAVQLYEECMDP